MSRTGLGFATFHATLVIWRQQYHGETDVVICLDFFYDRPSLASLLMQNDRFKSDFFQKAGDSLACFTVVAMDDEHAPRER
ncbi:hypothetical protein WT10_31175 [Burkholderia stagnalis]|nr:hypothetical protein WS59_26035 [Burkholderia stagnalis]KVN10286.1 hypothetical protein WT10_31175 [Burkholderia stagnalis]KWI73181.1 hypothetical protein WT75_11540 [Burkholderia stagnalis]KWK02945.1 hypothetical protein WT76_20735 [Burkholderia stagnalis]KWK67703.1 hypothetical protein WT82_00045 [Burkholderia stagnalis]